MRSGSASGGEHRHVEPAQREQVAFDQRGVREGAPRRRRRRPAASWNTVRLRMTARVRLTVHEHAEGPPHADLRAAHEGAGRAGHLHAADGAGRGRHRRGRRQGEAASSADDEVLGGADQGGEEAPRGGRRRSPTRAAPSRPRRSAPRARCSTATCRRSSPTRSWPSWSRQALAAGGFTGDGADGPGHEGGPGRGGRPGRGRPGRRRGTPAARLELTRRRDGRSRTDRWPGVALRAIRCSIAAAAWTAAVAVAGAARWIAGRRVSPVGAPLPLLTWMITTPPLMVRPSGWCRRPCRPGTARRPAGCRPSTWKPAPRRRERAASTVPALQPVRDRRAGRRARSCRSAR